MMQKLTSRLTGWLSLILIVHFLAGCTSIQARPELPPIYVKKSDIMCMAPETKRQIVAHNCKVDYDPKYCKFKETK